MKKKDIKKMTKSEIIKNLESSKKDLFNLRFQKNNGQLKSPSKFREIKKNIARFKTLMKGKDA
jgi:large subunit ribosomal protein L29|tara:strand:- start:844 stop:1032 length:189 start_codon:yes stop_codon:yes gene_type:complete